MPDLKIVTTSWDDGDPIDTEIADLLCSRRLPGTFYIPITGYLGRRTLGATDLGALTTAGFEIGAHSVSHRTLPGLNPEELTREVGLCKQELEQKTGSKVLMFCYPNGRYNAAVVRQVRRAGYEGARTTRMLSLRTDFPPFEMPTTVQAYGHPMRNYVKNLGRARNFSGLWKYSTELSRFHGWVDLGKHLFERVMKHGGIWHLYGHSWEVNEFQIWPDLREMLDYVAHREGVTYATNGQVNRLLEHLRRASHRCEPASAPQE